jgi:uncharacterized membrane protein YphA (DoxX/SURF4 family)
MGVATAAVTAGVWLAAGLLVVAGIGKLRVPDAAMATLHAIGLPSGRLAARVLGVGEIGLGLSVVLLGGRAAPAALAAAYAALLAVAARQRAAQLDCGCFGVAAAPVSRLHLGIDAAAAAAGLAGLAVPAATLAAVAADAGPIAAAAGLIALATGVGLVRALAVQAAEQLRRQPRPAGGGLRQATGGAA